MAFQHLTPQQRREYGIKGGKKTKAKYQDDPQHFADIGKKGFETRVKRLGGMDAFRQIASEMGKKSGQRRSQEEDV